jgi:dynein heavy chain
MYFFFQGKVKSLSVEGAQAWIASYCRGCKIAYKRKLDKLLIRINDMSKKLSHPIRDLDELSIGMQALRQIRENEVDMEMAIDPIEVNTEY